MKKILVFALFFLSCVFTYAQDIIVTKDSKRIDAKVMEININDVRYIDWDNQDGPIYTILKSEIASIIYRSGKVETFLQAAQPTAPAKQYLEAPLGMTYSRFKSMSDGEQLNYFEKNVGGNIYKNFQAGVKLRRVGTGLLIPGIVCTTAGILCIVLGSIYMDDYVYYESYYGYSYYRYNENAENAFIAGLVLFPIGQSLTIASIPLNAAGGAKKKRAQNEFINTYLKDSFTNTSLDFGVPQHGGLGLMLKF